MYKLKDFTKGSKFNCKAVAPQQIGKMPAIRNGVLTFHSTYYRFAWINNNGAQVTARGKKPKSKELTEKGFFIDCYNGDRMFCELTAI